MSAKLAWPVSVSIEADLSFFQGAARTQIESLARIFQSRIENRHAASVGGPPSLPDDASLGALPSRAGQLFAPSECEQCDLDCPVCLETLFQPVAPDCGHPVCRPCLERLVAETASPHCPLCPARGGTGLGGQHPIVWRAHCGLA